MERKHKRAIKKYGEEVCRMAYEYNQLGWGANSIGLELGLTTNQADAAINAYEAFIIVKEN